MSDKKESSNLLRCQRDTAPYMRALGFHTRKEKDYPLTISSPIEGFLGLITPITLPVSGLSAQHDEAEPTTMMSGSEQLPAHNSNRKGR